MTGDWPGVFLPVAMSRDEKWTHVGDGTTNGSDPLPAGRGIWFDFGAKRVGRIELELDATDTGGIRAYPLTHPDAEAAVVFSSEHYGQPEYPLTWGTQISGPLQFAHKPGTQTLTSAKTYAFRYLILKAEREVNLRAVRLIESRCPVQVEGNFECSDPAVNRAWAMGMRTLLLCIQPAVDSQQPIGQDGEYVIWDGCRRDREIWAGDLRPSALTLYGLTSDASAVRTSLRLIAERRFEDGLLPASASSRQVFVEYALWWIISLWEYYWHTGDRDFVAEMMPALRAQLKWLEHHTTPERLIEVSNTWSYTLPRAGVLSEANMVLAHALECAARLLSAEGGDSNSLTEWAGWVRQRVNEEFYDSERRLYNDQRRSVGWDGRTWGDNNAQAILLDIAPQMQWDGILGNLRNRLWRQRGAVVCDPLFDPDAIHNENKWAHNGTIWPFANAYEVGAWMKAGRIDEGLDLLKRFTGACADAGTETIWEMLYADGRIPESPDHRYLLSLCHAWGATGNHYLTRYVLGVAPLAPGYGRVRITPQLGSLEWARGVVPTPRGPIAVEARREADGRIRTHIAAKPDGIQIETGAVE